MKLIGGSRTRLPPPPPPRPSRPDIFVIVLGGLGSVFESRVYQRLLIVIDISDWRAVGYNSRC